MGVKFCRVMWVVVRLLDFVLCEMESYQRILNRGRKVVNLGFRRIIVVLRVGCREYKWKQRYGRRGCRIDAGRGGGCIDGGLDQWRCLGECGFRIEQSVRGGKRGGRVWVFFFFQDGRGLLRSFRGSCYWRNWRGLERVFGFRLERAVELSIRLVLSFFILQVRCYFIFYILRDIFCFIYSFIEVYSLEYIE